MVRIFFASIVLLGAALAFTASAGVKLTGTPIGSTPSVDYSKPGAPSTTTVNLPEDVFDGNLNTFYASYQRSFTWVGLDLGSQYVIDRVGFAPRNDALGPGRLSLGIIEGANSPDFIDAVPIYMIKAASVPIGSMTYADVTCSRGFRYVRYVGPADARCNIAELEFFGVEGAGEDSHLYQLTNIPTVVVNTVAAEEPYDKEHNIEARIIIISDNGTSLLDASGTARLRGNASMQFPKKPYRIKFDKKQRVLDAPAKAKKWTLINNYGDKTLLRNDVAFETARRLGMEYVPYLRSVDVILNGEYKGNYQLCDQVEVNDGRVDVEEMSPSDNSGDELTGGYLVEVDAYADQEVSWFSSAHGIPVTIKSPDEDDITPEQKAYITNYFNQVESRLWSSTTNGTLTYREIFDVNSFLRHFLVGEISGNTDTYWSTYMYKYRGNPVFYTGPVWDFDIAFDNDYRTYPLNNISGFLALSNKVSFANNMNQFVRRIINVDKQTPTDIRTLWDRAVANNDLSAESLNRYLDDKAALIDESQRLNFMRWPILNTSVHMNPVVSGSYKAEVGRMKSYIQQRFVHLWDIISKFEPAGVDDVFSPDYEIFYYGGEVHIAGFSDESMYSVYDSMGRQILSGTFDGVCNFTVTGKGIFIIRVIDAVTGHLLTKKIVF